MIEFNVGTNFAFKTIDKAVELNRRYKEDGLRISEFYGSLSGGTARPAFRIGNVSYTEIKLFIEECHAQGLKFNYTLNSPLTSYWFPKTASDFAELVRTLEDLKVDIVTISHMIPLEYIRQFFDIEISTILEVQSLEAIKYYTERFNAKKICLSITKNRDFEFLRKLKKHDLAQHIELLANEFCSIEGIPCQNFYRKSCYELHALGGNEKNEQHGYPLKICSRSRYKDPASWIKANVIFPWDVVRYQQKTGISKFKVSGRTLPTEYILYIMEAYMSQGIIMDDNILALWGHVDKVEKLDKTKIPKVYISAESMKSMRFLKFFTDDYIDCQKTLCSECVYCYKILQAALR